MMKVKRVFFGALLGVTAALSQPNPVTPVTLDTVTVDIPLHYASATQQVLVLVDSVLVNSRGSLASLLEYNAPFAVRQNGFGMVSSVSARGTSAQQTAVIWNGLNINSAFTGQTDFSTITPTEYQKVSIRSGGGSVMYGSSAIGGTIHLETINQTKDGSNQDLLYKLGSFNSNDFLYKIDFITKTISGVVSTTYNQSQNDYPLPDGGDNRNGAFYNASVNGSWRYTLRDRHTFQFFHRLYMDNRGFSLINKSETPTKYKNLNSASQLLYTQIYDQLTTYSRIAFLSEEYSYYGSPNGAPAVGSALSWIGKFEAAYKSNSSLWFNFGAEHTNTAVQGTNIVEVSRNVSAFSGLVNYHMTPHLEWVLGARQEYTKMYQSPFLFSGGFVYKPSQLYRIRANFSRNFRIPTFNDLYWVDGGNSALRPETSIQAEVGQEYNGFLGSFKTTFFYIEADNMIQWVPINSNQWQPQNLKKTTSKGIEALWNSSWTINQVSLGATGSYSYTIAENDLTGKTLIYVPLHRANASVSFAKKAWSCWLQGLYTGAVHTRSDNNIRYMLDPFLVLNMGLQHQVKPFLRFGIQAFNIAEQNYQTVEGRPMPGRHFQIFINLNL